ncbi:MAG: hypothetical protein MI741_14455, partial [Rhodospirillales bacterium]|nr:hypothetical protein [Rhodospirillales bacterium]
RKFVAWLQTDAAQTVLAWHRIYNKGHAPKLTNTALKEPIVEPRSVWVGPIEGAAALLPTKMVSPYFLMARPEHQDFYEQAIFEALAADGRLDLVDRQRMDDLLRERKLHALNPPREHSPGPLVAADIFILPNIITHDDAAYLRILALHAPTAAVLDALDVPLNPKQPTRFDRPLAEIVAEWWPRVLTALHAARMQPRWHMFGFTADGIHQVPPAQRAYDHLLAHLRSRREVFCVDGPVLTGTQREVLMRLMGLSRDRAGGFTPVFDYLVEGRQSSSSELTLTVNDANFQPIAETRIRADALADRLKEASQWLDDQMQAHRQRLSDGAVDEAARHRGAKLQSRLAWNAATELGFAYVDHAGLLTERIPSKHTAQQALDYAIARERRTRFARRSWTYRLAVEQLGGPTDTLPKLSEWTKPQKNHSTIAAPDPSWLSEAQRNALIDRWSKAAREATELSAEQEKLIAEYKKQGVTLNSSYSSTQPSGFEISELYRQYWQHIE